MGKCVAIATGDHIELIIRKEDEGYNDFAKVLRGIDEQGYMSWYGDVEDAKGKEQSGLVITSKILHIPA